MGNYLQTHQQSIQQPEIFWGEQAKRIYWEKPFLQVLDYSAPPFAKWFVDGKTSICYNALDRHLKDRADQTALIAVSVETNTEQTYSYQELYLEVNRMAAILKSYGVGKGDRVLIYMPMVAQACFAMLAVLRLGAIHSVVFGGFAAHSLAARIEDAEPKFIITAEAGMRAGKVVPYKPLLDEAIKISAYKPEHVLIVSRGLCDFALVAGRDVDYAVERQKHMDDLVPCEWLNATDPSYILYTSGTTGKPKGVQRDTGGYAVALATSMEYIFCAKPGQTMFCTSDIGWVVGHGYIIYGSLIHGMATIMFEGTPLKPDPGIWWSLVEKYRVSTMFSSPTAIRVLKKQDPQFINNYDLSSLESFFLAGEPLDEPTAQWISGAIQKPIIDNYWQTETGWPILSLQRGIEDMPNKFGSPGVPVFGYNMKLLDDVTGEELPANAKGLLAIEGPLPPGCMQTVWGDDQRFVSTYWQSFAGRLVYSTFDWGIKDEDGYFFILGRTDDVINTAGHRLGTREIEESISSHPNIAEVAVVGVADELKGQVAIAFAIPKSHSYEDTFEKELMNVVDQQLGPVARPARIYIVDALPKTRSGKIVRRALQAIAEHRDTGDISTMEDKNVLNQIKEVIFKA
ncbi:propionate--CoA ligase [Polynucleobacter sp. SHI8]|uniref:propionate--CoA ligase n=1 Tax=unclassified Polynucleobacter TaxID=2640945 RepID=UPI00248FA9CB|nr:MULTISPECIES: propionate--CoA ligase [unclassified Polynucleobacter]BDW10593.1 propionate--CoA ligase [Polynucleobacter sp. SHI2]BDW13039.1 propionate--CoA ligase [Polynucleobacter sp. SHI8]